MSPDAELIEKKLRVSGVKMKLISALDLPGQIDQGLGLGIISASEAAALRDYDRLVMNLINVDEFAVDDFTARGNIPPAAS